MRVDRARDDLERRRCEIWWCRSAVVDADAWWWLAPEERHRCHRLRFEGDRRRFVAGCLLLRAGAATRLGVDPRDVPVVRTCGRCGGDHGRARIDHPRAPEVTVSHAGDVAMVAFATGTRVGIDVESLGRRPDVERLAATVLDDLERATLADAPTGRRVERFLQIWTRKEAVLKALGVGLGADPAELSLRTPDLAAVRAWPSGVDVPAAHCVVDVPAPHGYVAGLAAFAPSVEITMVDAGDRLPAAPAGVAS